MAYTAAQYAAQERLMVQIRHAQATGTCPVCGAPQAYWPDGVRRITCGSAVCFERWLNVRPAVHSSKRPPPDLGVDSLDAAPNVDGFTVGLVIG